MVSRRNQPPESPSSNGPEHRRSLLTDQPSAQSDSPTEYEFLHFDSALFDPPEGRTSGRKPDDSPLTMIDQLLGVIDTPLRAHHGGNESVRPDEPVVKTQLTNQWLVHIVLIAVAALSSAGLLIAQQASFRLLAPLIGSSVETWSAIIGVFLLGIAAGNAMSGRLSDRMPSHWMISSGLLTGAISIWLMPRAADLLAQWPAFQMQSLTVQIFLASLLTCFVPGAALSVVTPSAIRGLVSLNEDVGRAAGRISMWGTLGSLAGNYLAGFVLLALLGVREIIGVTGAVLSCLALIAAWGCRQLVMPEKTLTEECLNRPETTPVSCARTPQPRAVRTPVPWNESAAPMTSDASGRWMWKAVLIVTACSFVTGAVEGAAFRILAPLVGVSMFLTSGVVGVILAGMSAGNALGGYLAARKGTKVVLENSLLASAVSTLLIAPLWKLLLSTGLFRELSLIPQIIGWSFSLFFLPSLALGTITPQVIRLSVQQNHQSGSVSGRLYAWSTLGCIAGILAAGWYLIETVGAVRTCLLCGMIPCGLLFLLRKELMKGTLQASDDGGSAVADRTPLLWLLLASAVVLLAVCQSPYTRESRYFSLAVNEEVIDGRSVRVLVLDRLVHSAIDPGDPSFLHYPHERIQGEFVRAAAMDARAHGRAPRILVIGGGGYSFPRWIESQSDLNDVIIEVVEIDPAVTAIAVEKLALSPDTRIRSIHMDGRQFVKGNSAARYDVIIQDAVNDFSVPWHLMTQEYNRLIKRLLHPEGVFLLTVIDSMDSGRFLASAVRTVESSFAETRLLAPAETHALSERSVFVIAGRSPSSVESAGLAADDWWPQRSQAHFFPPAEVSALLRRRAKDSPVLSDNYAPVDTLMTSHFLNARH